MQLGMASLTWTLNYRALGRELKEAKSLRIPPPPPVLWECLSYSPKFSSASVAGLSRLSDEGVLMVIKVPLPCSASSSDCQRGCVIYGCVIYGCLNKRSRGLRGKSGWGCRRREKTDGWHHQPARCWAPEQQPDVPWAATRGL